jgi:hypothetical protein
VMGLLRVMVALSVGKHRQSQRPAVIASCNA